MTTTSYPNERCSSIYWPGTGVIKSQRNDFTAHLTQPASTIRYPAKFGAKGVQTRFQQDASKAAIHDLRAAA